MNKQREETILLDDNIQIEDSVPTTLISAAKLHEAKIRAHSFAPELGLDPLYTPFIEAAAELRQKIEAQNRNKIEEIKRETAEQTKTLYNKLSEAREEFKRLQDSYQSKFAELDELTSENLALKEKMITIEANLQQQQEELQGNQMILSGIQQQHLEEVDAIHEKNNILIDKLKSKVDQVSQDYQQQLTHLQQKISYQKQQLTDENTLLQDENNKLATELSTLRNEQQGSGDVAERIARLESSNTNLQQTLKEKSERLLRNEHALKLANEELERNQQYVKELEEKNNTIQKELFENWIYKKEEL